MDVHPVLYDQLIAYAALELDENGISQVTTHVNECLECAATVHCYRQVRAFLRLDGMHAPPPHTLARTYAIFSHHRHLLNPN
ncbi:hypothetical protein ANRL1_04188 [Anaerolineae bacterium]|nr:hypothetical protein ANRL1_04188 [Anaerolineae bacterium]